MNKYILITIFLISFSCVQAQVGIETTPVRAGAILDFPDPAEKSILLPKNSNTSNSGTEPGSLAFDVATQTVVYYSDKTVNGSTEGWVPLTNAATDVKSDIEVLTNGKENGEGVLITDITNNTSVPVGVLELKSDTKALILPSVANIDALPVAEPGAICYVKDGKVFAIFNGEKWSFWK
ncbi:hypothetical protein GO491_09080 [Flavobacteriaceae bacterium Ap0902]|nr:hypothetical protein [Flavobacteriaceae bacterium Ap0902]